MMEKTCKVSNVDGETLLVAGPPPPYPHPSPFGARWQDMAIIRGHLPAVQDSTSAAHHLYWQRTRGED